MKSKIILLYFLILGSINGCTAIHSEALHSKRDTNILNATQQTKSQAELEKIMAFDARFSVLSNQEKKIECNRIRREYKITEDWIKGWSLAYAISNFPACGTLSEGLELLKKAQDMQHHTGQSLWLIKHQINLLSQIKKLQKQKRNLAISLKLNQEQLLKTEEEKNTMELKLLELTTIETSINKRLEEEHNEDK